MTPDPQSPSDDALYALLGITTATVNAPTPITPNTALTTSVAESPNLETTSTVPVEPEDTSTIPLRPRRKHRRGKSSRVRRTAERELQRISADDDSDEPVKETAHTKIINIIDSMHRSAERPDKSDIKPLKEATHTKLISLIDSMHRSAAKFDKPDTKFDETDSRPDTSRSNPYWMYGKGLEIPPYNPSSVKKEAVEVKNEVDKEMVKPEGAEVQGDKEVKEKDFADIQPDTAIPTDIPVNSEKPREVESVACRKPFNAEDLLAQLIQSIEMVHIKQEESVPMTKVPSTITDEGLTTADESFHTDTDTETKPRRRFHVVQHQSRVRGSSKRRTRYQIVRHIPPFTELDPSAEVEVKVEPEPLPETPFQRDLQSTFSRSALLLVNELAKSDNASGNRLPSHLRDLFPALSDKTSAITIANHLRRQLDLPLLSTKTDGLALLRAVAQMRLGLYNELVSALILPSAPIPAPDTDDEEIKEKKKKISLAPSALQYMQKALPAAFPNDKFAIKVFLGNHDPFGEMKGKVVWQDGIGTMVGGDPMGPGFRGKVSSEGLVHCFVDHSNVLHGLTQKFKHVKSVALPPPHLRTLSLPVLSLLLRRGRPTPHGTLHLVASSPLYQNLDPLVRLGWEVSVLKRVEIYADEVHDAHSAKLVPKPLSNMTTVNAFHEGGSRRYKEQGVDEILHLKILQALNTKSTPAPKGSTIVLATGDAKGGQFNQDGFVGAVREAIKRGWMVELWSFSDGLSRAWKDLKKKEHWGGDFTIKLLDEWSEQLVEVGDGD